MRKANAIITSDWHLREDQPICRTDNFWEAQWNQVDQVAVLQRKHGCPVLHGGDLYHHWKPSPYLLSTTKKHLPKKFYSVYGQHDLPSNNFDLRDKSGLHDLEISGFVKIIPFGNWGQKMTKKELLNQMIWPKQPKPIGVIHRFVWDGKTIPWPGCNEITATKLLAKYSKLFLLVTGDHHKTFVVNNKKQMLINPGCFQIQDASYKNHEPCVFLWYAKENVVEYIYLKVEKDVVTTEHLDIEKERNDRIDAFISKLKTDWKSGIHFDDNLKIFIQKNKLKSSFVKLIYKILESYEKEKR